MKVPENFWDWWSASDERERAMAEATRAEVAERQAVAQRLAAVRVQLERALPAPLKAKLASLRAQGTTASGFIRFLLEEHFKQAETTGRKGR